MKGNSKTLQYKIIVFKIIKILNTIDYEVSEQNCSSEIIKDQNGKPQACLNLSCD